MILLNLKILAIASAAAFAVGSLSGTYLTNKYKNNVFEGRIIEQEREATRILNEEREKSRAIELQLSLEKDQLETEHAKKSKQIRDLNGKYIAAVNTGKRLRDPHAGKDCENGMSANSGTTPKSSSGGGPGILSAETSRFLLNEASRADQVLTDLSLCKAWVKQVTKALGKH